MKFAAILALGLATANALIIPDQFKDYKPGYMRIPGWEQIASGERKLHQKPPTMKFTPRDDVLPYGNLEILFKSVKALTLKF